MPAMAKLPSSEAKPQHRLDAWTAVYCWPMADNRNARHTTVDWHFTTADVRIKLKPIPFNLNNSGD
jgi:hypothetical protein